MKKVIRLMSLYVIVKLVSDSLKNLCLQQTKQLLNIFTGWMYHLYTESMKIPMKQAKYDPTSIGHIGLATDYYTHFTSPIRRYPDLIVHRLIRTYLLKGDMNSKTLKKWKGLLPEITQHTSTMERAAIDTERE